MKLIDADRLIERIKKETKLAKILVEGLGEELNGKFWEGVILEKKNMIKKLEQEPQANQWISCKEKIQEKDDKYKEDLYAKGWNDCNKDWHRRIEVQSRLASNKNENDVKDLYNLTMRCFEDLYDDDDIYVYFDQLRSDKLKKYKLFIRRYNLLADDYILEEKVVETDDIYHEIGYIYCTSIEAIKRIDYYEIKEKVDVD